MYHFTCYFLFHSLFLFFLHASGLFFNFYFIKLLYWIFFFTRFKKYFPPVIPPAVCVYAQCVQLFVTPWTVPTRLLCPWNFPCKNTDVGCRFFQGIFLTLGSYPASPVSTGKFFTTEPPGKLHHWQYTSLTAIFLHVILYLLMCRFKKLTAVYFQFCSLSLWAIVAIILLYVFYKYRVNLYYFYFRQSVFF